MAHFYGSRSGNKGKSEVTRTGTKSNGIQAHVRGWNCGVEVVARWEDGRQTNCFDIYRTSGSSGTGGRILLTTFREGD